MDDGAHRLLEMTKTIILPGEIDHDAYSMIVEAALLYPDDEIDLYCGGDGGLVRDSFAIVDVIKRHGNFTGLLAGMAYSSHADIWAGCNVRYCYPMSGIGLHRVKFSSGDSFKDARYFGLKAEEGNALDGMIAGLFADASNADASIWMKIIADAGDSIRWIYAEQIIRQYEMALPIADRPQFATDTKGIEIKLLDGSPIPKDDYL